MRLPELCLALLCAAAGTGSPGSARDQPPGAAGGRAEGAGRGVPGAAAPRVGGVDPRHAWMLLAGSPGRARGSRARGRTGTVRDGTGAGTAQAALKVGVPGPASVPPGTLAVLEELLRELQLLLKAMVKEQAKMRRKAWEGREEEEESGEGNPQAGSHRRVEAAFRCQTRENISIEQRAQRELQLYYIPEREGMFHRGSGLNLTSGQYTAPIAGYYAFTATLHLVRREQRRKWQPCRGNRLRVLVCVQSRCQHNSNLETVSWLESGVGLFTISVTGVLYLQAGQYASVFVDNAADSPLTVQSGSDFSAILIGV
ncbi:erythroferrone isoform X4 [Rissa tridactyla]|uniref:erythroferrone isoform X4 n=1 Tax=Rissa tridactyla TaxID=75485 RepID=UPI0023BA6378|nr:erythroferrone isoform X4 [Rissa tridactyla]